MLAGVGARGEKAAVNGAVGQSGKNASWWERTDPLGWGGMMIGMSSKGH